MLPQSLRVCERNDRDAMMIKVRFEILRERSGILGRNCNQHAPASASLALEPIDRVGKFFGDVADRANCQIDSTHGAGGPDHTVRGVFFQCEAPNAMQRMRNQHAELPARTAVDPT